MRYCPVCGTEVPRNIVIDGKSYSLQRRKFCFKCSPHRGHNTKNLTKKEKTIADGSVECNCKYCNKIYYYKTQKGMAKNICNSCRTFIRRCQIKKQMLEYKGNKCEKCGYTTENWRNLSFHHLEKDDKKFDLSLSYQKSWDEIKIELDKCILVCHHCHNDLHNMETEVIKKKMQNDGLF